MSVLMSNRANRAFDNLGIGLFPKYYMYSRSLEQSYFHKFKAYLKLDGGN